MTSSSNDKNPKKLVSRREFLAGSSAVIAAITLMACSPKISTSIANSGTVPIQANQVTTTTATTPAGLSTPKRGGVLKIIGRQMPATIGWPAEMSTGGGVNSQACLETLLRGDDKGNIVPWLAESYKISDDLKSITFNIRKGVRFHDGSDLNAEVVKWNLENLLAAMVEPYWASVDFIDDYTVRVNFTQWVNTLPASFGDTLNLAYMVSKAAFDKNGIDWMRQNPVGTGPFKFSSFNLDVSFKVVKNPDYWAKDAQGNQLPYLDGIEHVSIADFTTQKFALQAGQGDMLDNVSAGKQAADIAALGMKLDITLDMTYVLIPDTANADSPWSNQKIREAAEYAIDREAIAKAFGYGYFQAAYQLPPHYTLAYNPDFTLDRKFNPEKAKQLLAEAGHPDGFQTTIIVAPMADKDISVAIQADLAKVGIKADMEYPDFAKFFMSYNGSNGAWHNAAIFSIIAAGDTNYIGGIQFIFDNIGQSWSRTSEMNQAYQSAITTPVPDIKLVRAVTDMITRDALIIPVHGGGSGRAMRPYVVANYNKRGYSSDWNREDAWLNK